MKFSKDTSRLVEGRWYWYHADGMLSAHRVRYTYELRVRGYLWGDECPPPTVEVEPERPATPALLPCPFCGGTEVGPSSTEDKPEWNQWVLCASCGAEGPIRTGGHAGAYEGWNTRAAPPAPTPPVEPERPAWTPPVCPAGQVFLEAKKERSGAGSTATSATTRRREVPRD